MIKFINEEHYAIYLEVDRLYHGCETSEGRCAVISDYIVRLLNNRLTPVAAEAVLAPANAGDGDTHRAAEHNG